MPAGSSQQGELKPLIGASVLSSVGSLPLHLVPLIVVALIADSRASVAGAGWVASAILFGQLSTALALPALKIYSVDRKLATATAVLLMVGLTIADAAGYMGILTGWFLVGQCCGVLSYLGTITASRFARPAFAFSLRLATVLIFAGCVCGGLLLSGMLISYRGLLTVTMLAIIPMLAVGIILHRLAEKSGPNPKYGEQPRSKGGPYAGLVMMYCFFVGQTGFLAYVVQQVVGRGMTFGSTALSLALMKLAAGVWILCSALFGSEESSRTRFWHLSWVLVAAIVMLSYSTDILVF